MSRLQRSETKRVAAKKSASMPDKSRSSVEKRRRIVGELFRAIAGILRDGQKRGELREDLDPELAWLYFHRRA